MTRFNVFSSKDASCLNWPLAPLNVSRTERKATATSETKELFLCFFVEPTLMPNANREYVRIRFLANNVNKRPPQKRKLDTENGALRARTQERHQFLCKQTSAPSNNINNFLKSPRFYIILIARVMLNVITVAVHCDSFEIS